MAFFKYFKYVDQNLHIFDKISHHSKVQKTLMAKYSFALIDKNRRTNVFCSSHIFAFWFLEFWPL